MFRRASFFFFFNDTATTEIYTLSLHDALPIYANALWRDAPVSPLELPARIPPHNLDAERAVLGAILLEGRETLPRVDRKSTRLNSSHSQISYAVFCLKKKKTIPDDHRCPRVCR